MCERWVAASGVGPSIRTCAGWLLIGVGFMALAAEHVIGPAAARLASECADVVFWLTSALAGGPVVSVLSGVGLIVAGLLLQRVR